MSRARVFAIIGVLGVLVSSVGCGPAPGASEGEVRAVTALSARRASRRLFDGAPPVIPHEFSGDCVACHSREGTRIENLGTAPAAPHAPLTRPGPWARCTQCHVQSSTVDAFVASEFKPWVQDLRRGHRAHPLAPPMMPHLLVGRENCQACHTGISARPEILCDHPERGRCQQCHLAPRSDTEFSAALR